MRNINGVITSSPSEQEVEFTTVNKTNKNLKVGWINYDGNYVTSLVYSVPAGGTVSPGKTYINHVWLATDADTGACVKIINVEGANIVIE